MSNILKMGHLPTPDGFNGHVRNRFIGGTYQKYKAYFLGLSFREYPIDGFVKKNLPRSPSFLTRALCHR